MRLSIDLPAAPDGAEPIDVLVALTEDDLSSVVRRGENGGRTLTHVAVVRTLESLGSLERESFVADGQLALDRSVADRQDAGSRLAPGTPHAARLRRRHRAAGTMTARA